MFNLSERKQIQNVSRRKSKCSGFWEAVCVCICFRVLRQNAQIFDSGAISPGSTFFYDVCERALGIFFVEVQRPITKNLVRNSNAIAFLYTYEVEMLWFNELIWHFTFVWCILTPKLKLKWIFIFNSMIYYYSIYKCFIISKIIM